jgi:hypothetical protein
MNGVRFKAKKEADRIASRPNAGNQNQGEIFWKLMLIKIQND